MHGKNDKIFLEALRSIESGVIILDMEAKGLFFTNTHAETILASLELPVTHKDICAVMTEGLKELRDETKKRSGQQTLHKGNHFIGYTAYRLQDSRKYILLFIQDITDRKRLDSIAEAIETSNNLGFIFSGIRHEIGNPLNSVKMALSVLKANCDSFTREDFLVYFERMAADVGKMEGILKAFRHFNMFENPVRARVDLREFFKNFIKIAEQDLLKSGIETRIELSPGAALVDGDERALNQVLLNIVTNAKDALEEQSEAILEIRSQRSGKVILISIRDNGCGMSEEQVKHLFKPFHTTKPHGTGLGLVIAKKMLAQMNAGIDIKTKNGEGTTVTLILPQSNK